MDLFEYQAKELFAEYGVPVQRGRVASTPEEAREIAAGYAAEGSSLVVVKAQVKTGGRGKAGGVKLANGPDEAEAKARQILGMDIKGHTVHKVLIAEASDIAQEYYLSFLLDRAARTFVAICSVQGGVEIEEVAHTNPEAVARIPVNPLAGVDAAKAAEIIQAGGLPPEAAQQAAVLAERLWSVFADEDATLVEVNPMALTDQGDVLAVDGKVSLDDNASFRQDHAKFADPGAADPLEARAKAKHLNYVKLDGQVGIIGNGAGLVMSTLDVVALAGEPFGGMKPANFLDIGGGASAEVMADGLEIVLSDTSVRSVLVNVFGGITSCDAVANGIVSAIGMLAAKGEEVRHPIVVRLDGNNAEEGRRILADAGLPVVEQVATMDDAARRAAELAAAACGSREGSRGEREGAARPVGCVRILLTRGHPRGRTLVDLFEYQAKELFAEYGVPVQRGRVASTPEEAREIAAGYAAEGSSLVVVKAQVKTGGRGKAGGVKLANGPDEAEAKARQILGMDIKGHTVHKVLIAEASDIAQEYYLSFLLDRAARTFVAICSVQGGVEIEEVAHTNPRRSPGSRSTRWPGWTRPRPLRSSRPAACRPRRRSRRRCSPSGSGPCSPTRTPPWSRSTRWP